MSENKIESDFLSQLGYTAFSLNKKNAITVLLKYKAYLIEQAKKGKVTLQECKDKVALEEGSVDFKDLISSFNKYRVEICLDKAAEMYANQFIPAAPADDHYKSIERPIGDFIFDQADIKPLMLQNGAYYYYGDVCTMLNRIQSTTSNKQP